MIAAIYVQRTIWMRQSTCRLSDKCYYGPKRHIGNHQKATPRNEFVAGRCFLMIALPSKIIPLL